MIKEERESRAANDRVARAVKDLRRQRSGTVSDTERIIAIRRLMETGRIPTSEPLLPLVLNLKGDPYSLANHFPFSPFFRTRKPSTVVLKTGRQVSKSTSLAADGIMTSVINPNFATLFVTPRYEQIRRFSTNYVADFLKQSPIQSMFAGAGVDSNVLQRSFTNFSKMIFSFALLDADRIRGVSANKVAIDEVQDMDREHIPIIRETMSNSPTPLMQFTGTPKTLDNFIETAWRNSSMAEWFIPCFACGEWNIPALEYHLLEMIGPYRSDISDDNPATVCHKCRRPINPRYGRWVHRVTDTDKRWSYAGYHVPQVIMPIHYAHPGKWEELLNKQQGAGGTSPHVFINEVLGESSSTGSQLVTQADLEAVSKGENGLPWKNDTRTPDPRAIARRNDAISVALGIDWGGGGVDGVSFTTLAIVAMMGNGQIEVLWGKRLMTPHEHIREAMEIVHWAQVFRPDFIAHDYTGAGIVRETVLQQMGIPLPKLMPFSYVGAAMGPMIRYKAATDHQPRPFYTLDKTRSLMTTCNAIKTGMIKFFQYDRQGDEERGLIHDFIALVDEKREVPTGRDLYLIRKAEGFTDDFAHSVNLGAVGCWHVRQAWPNFASVLNAEITPAQLAWAMGANNHWNEEPPLGYMAQNQVF